MGTEVNLLRICECLKNKIEHSKKSKKKIWSLYIDLKSAFDTVDHDIMFDKMRKLGVNIELHNTI